MIEISAVTICETYQFKNFNLAFST